MNDIDKDLPSDKVMLTSLRTHPMLCPHCGSRKLEDNDASSLDGFTVLCLKCEQEFDGLEMYVYNFMPMVP